MMNETKVSFCENIKIVTNGKEMPGTQLLSNIKEGRWKDKAAQIRAVEDEAERRKLKSEILPCATISGTFSSRNGKNLINHSGLLCIDIDKIKDEKVENELE